MIVCVSGGKGGPGATVLAANLAICVAGTGRHCLLVDLDPFGGDLGAYLEPERLDPRRGLLPLLKLEGGSISPDAVERESQKVVPGLLVLLGSLRPAAQEIAGRAADLLRSAESVADVVVADLGRTVPDSPSLAALAVAHRCLLAAHPDLQGALAAERALSSIDRAARVDVVATKVYRRGVADVAELSDALDREITTSIPASRIPVRLNPMRRVRGALSPLVDDLTSERPTTDVTRHAVQEVVAS